MEDEMHDERDHSNSAPQGHDSDITEATTRAGRSWVFMNKKAQAMCEH